MDEVGGDSTTPANDVPSHWTATEAITWLAFGKAESGWRLDAWRSDFRARWNVREYLAPVRALLEARAYRPRYCPIDGELFAILSYDRCDDPAAVVPRDGSAFVRSIRRRVRQEQERLVSYADLISLLDADAAQRDQRREALQAATDRLVEALRAGRITALGVPLSDPAARHETVPAEVFLLAMTIRGDALEPDERKSEMRAWVKASEPRHRYTDLRFRVADVRKLRRVEAPAAQTERPIPQAMLRAWWFEDYLPRHSDLDTRPKTDQQRADAARHFEALGYAPPSVRAMQELRAHSETPPEWRAPGPRPRSQQVIETPNPPRAD